MRIGDCRLGLRRACARVSDAGAVACTCVCKCVCTFLWPGRRWLLWESLEVSGCSMALLPVCVHLCARASVRLCSCARVHLCVCVLACVHACLCLCQCLCLEVDDDDDGGDCYHGFSNCDGFGPSCCRCTKFWSRGPRKNSLPALCLSERKTRSHCALRR